VLGEEVVPRWLYVPWENISDIREDKAHYDEYVMRCAAFDVVATSDEVDEFFFNLIGRRRARRFSGNRVPVGFYICNILGVPRARKVVEIIVWMANRHNNRLHCDAATPRA
jgi:hypothetical protein